MEKRTLISIMLATAAVVAALVFAAVYVAPAETDYTGDWTSVQEEWTCDDGTSQGAIADTLTLTAAEDGLCSGRLLVNGTEDLGNFVGTLAGGRLNFSVGTSQYSGVFWSDDVLFTCITAIDDDGHFWAGSVVFVRNGAAVPMHYIADFEGRSYTVTDSVALVQYDENYADGMGGTVFMVTEQNGAALRILVQPGDGSEPWYTVAALAYGRTTVDSASGLYCNNSGSMSIVLTADTMQLDLANGFASETVCCGTTDGVASVLTDAIWQSETAVMLNEQGEFTARSAGLTVEILSQSGTRFYGSATVAETQYYFNGTFHRWGSAWVGLAVLANRDCNICGTLTLRTTDGTALSVTATVTGSGEICTAALKEAAPDYTGVWQISKQDWANTDSVTHTDPPSCTLTISSIVGSLCSGTLDAGGIGQVQAFAGYCSGTHISFTAGGFTYSGRFWSSELLILSAVGTDADGTAWAGTLYYAREPTQFYVTEVPSFTGQSYTCTAVPLLFGELIISDADMVGAVFTVTQDGSLMTLSATLTDGTTFDMVGAVALSPAPTATVNVRFAIGVGQVTEATISSTGLILGGSSSSGALAELIYCGTAVPSKDAPNLGGEAWQASSAVTMSADGQSGAAGAVSLTLLSEDSQVFCATLKVGDSSYDLAGVLLQRSGSIWQGYAYAGAGDISNRVLLAYDGEILSIVMLDTDGNALIVVLSR